jgi:hypothetical protein
MSTIDKSVNNQKMFISLKSFSDFVREYQHVANCLVRSTQRCATLGYEGQLQPKPEDVGVAKYWWHRFSAYNSVIDVLSLPIEKYPVSAHADLTTLD